MKTLMEYFMNAVLANEAQKRFLLVENCSIIALNSVESYLLIFIEIIYIMQQKPPVDENSMSYKD